MHCLYTFHFVHAIMAIYYSVAILVSSSVSCCAVCFQVSSITISSISDDGMSPLSPQQRSHFILAHCHRISLRIVAHSFSLQYRSEYITNMQRALLYARLSILCLCLFFFYFLLFSCFVFIAIYTANACDISNFITFNSFFTISYFYAMLIQHTGLCL